MTPHGSSTWLTAKLVAAIILFPRLSRSKACHGELSQQVEEQMPNVVGKPIDFDELDQDIMHLKGTGAIRR